MTDTEKTYSELNETDFLVFTAGKFKNKSSRNILSSISIIVITVEPPMMMTFLKYHANFNVFIIKSGGLLERAQFRKSGDFNFNSATTF